MNNSSAMPDLWHFLQLPTNYWFCAVHTISALISSVFNSLLLYILFISADTFPMTIKYLFISATLSQTLKSLHLLTNFFHAIIPNFNARLIQIEKIFTTFSKVIFGAATLAHYLCKKIIINLV